jgi:hypothetical protein
VIRRRAIQNSPLIAIPISIPMKLLPFRFRRVLLAAAPLFLLSSGCESSTGSGAEVYTLVSVRGMPLPALYGGGILTLPLLVTEGTLELRRDGTGAIETTLRCPATLPPGTECFDLPAEEVPLTWSREEEWVRIRGAQYSATFDGDDAVTIYYPNEFYEYRR